MKVENSGYLDVNGNQIHFGDTCMVYNLKTPTQLTLRKSENKHDPYFQKAMLNDTGELAIDGMYWEIDWGGLPVILSDFKNCKIVRP